jgi:hypothetical protein
VLSRPCDSGVIDRLIFFSEVLVMSAKKCTSTSRIAFFFLSFLVAATGLATAAGPSEKTVYAFPGPPDGMSPQAGLVSDASGNLYGTTFLGGVQRNCCGTVFELSPPATAGGPWSETVLHTFTPDEATYPAGTLTFDKQGNLYGTATEWKGSQDTGAIFELSPPVSPGGAWTETVLWVFGIDGAYPSGKLAIDPAGNLYGIGTSGNASCCGIAFELIAPKTSGGSWSKRVIYRFGAFPDDGILPGNDLLLRNGVLYGVTQIGKGSASNGTVFQLVRKTGLWKETILHRFTWTDGLDPVGGLIADSAGNLFGAASLGGNGVACPGSQDGGCGTIYELSPPAVAGDPWQETTLHAFTNPGDGKNPVATLSRDNLNNLYGTASGGGKNTGTFGTVFKLHPPATSGGTWNFVVLHYFNGVASGDGVDPRGRLLWVNGALYGTTNGGGVKVTPTISGGTVFSVAP